MYIYISHTHILCIHSKLYMFDHICAMICVSEDLQAWASAISSCNIQARPHIFSWTFMDESHGPQSLQRSSNTWIRSYPYSCILLTRNWESCRIYCNSREPLLRITGWFAGENMRQECSVAGMNWGMLIFMFFVCPWFLGQETEIVTRVVWAYSALALAGSLQEQEANHSRLKKFVCWFDWLDTIGHDWSNYLRTKNSIGSIGLVRPEVPPVFGRHCNGRTQDGSRYPIAVLNAKVLYFCPLFGWLSGKIGDVERQPDASYAVCSVASVIFASC